MPTFMAVGVPLTPSVSNRPGISPKKMVAVAFRKERAVKMLTIQATNMTTLWPETRAAS